MAIIPADLRDVVRGGGSRGPGPDRGAVFQSPCLLPWLTAFENVMLGVNQVFSAASKEQRRQVAIDILQRRRVRPDRVLGRPVQVEGVGLVHGGDVQEQEDPPVLGRPGEVWLPESGVDRLVVIRTPPAEH